MIRRTISKLFVLTVMCLLAILPESCRKSDTEPEQTVFSVSLPGSLKNGLYYPLNYTERSIILQFSLPVDTSGADGFISLSDGYGGLDSNYTLVFSGKKVMITFNPGFRLKDGWKYIVTISPGLKSTTGVSFHSTATIEIRTTARNPDAESDSTGRNAIVCISDIHMGDQRAVNSGYCWFSKNAPALESLLDMVISNGSIKQLVILGDLFDGWVIPYRISPFDQQSGIHDIREYFISVANSPVNINIINKLRSIALAGETELVYVPGNHDMLLTKEILQEIIPGIVWQGDAAGLGHYSPLNEMVMEHGHRYDFFNCPQPLAVPGHILPPGYFISRLDAEGLMEHGGSNAKNFKAGSGDVEFLAAWTAAYTYLKVKYSLTVAADSANIIMSDVDDYDIPLSFNGVRDMYAAGIENEWTSTQSQNMVPVGMPVLMAILDGSSDLYLSSAYEYMQSFGQKNYKTVVFGHTHNPMIGVYPAGNQYTGIYANTGSWVNAELSSKAVRTFVVIKPGVWTGSTLDVISLYQYNLDSGSGDPDPGYKPVLLSEESIEK